MPCIYSLQYKVGKLLNILGINRYNLCVIVTDEQSIMLGNYVAYLDFLNQKLLKFFDSQKPYIFCKQGCARCCKNAQFPYSAIEFRYLLNGALQLDKCTQKKIEINIKNIFDKKKKYSGKKFLYDCPFLIDDCCSVYNYRGVICRTFGLMTNTENQKIKAPFCAFQGLNYSNVLNLRKKTISVRKFKKLQTDLEPLGFNISYKYLTGEDYEEAFNLKFGESKPLIEWFE